MSKTERSRSGVPSLSRPPSESSALESALCLVDTSDPCDVRSFSGPVHPLSGLLPSGVPVLPRTRTQGSSLVLDGTPSRRTVVSHWCSPHLWVTRLPSPCAWCLEVSGPRPPEDVCGSYYGNLRGLTCEGGAVRSETQVG